MIGSQDVVEIFPHGMSARKSSSSTRIEDKTPHVLPFDGVIAGHVFGVGQCARRLAAEEHGVAAGGVILVLVLEELIVGVSDHRRVGRHRR